MLCSKTGQLKVEPFKRYVNSGHAGKKLFFDI
jgi:hypothetical protein